MGNDIMRHRRKMLDDLSSALDGMGLHHRRAFETFDIYLPECKVAVEICDKLTHNEQCSPLGEPKGGEYIRAKLTRCSEMGVRLVCAYEHSYKGPVGWDDSLLAAVRSLALPRSGGDGCDCIIDRYSAFTPPGVQRVAMVSRGKVAATVTARRDGDVATLYGWMQRSSDAPSDWERRMALWSAGRFGAKTMRSVLDMDMGGVGYVPEGAVELPYLPIEHDYGDGFTVGMCGHRVFEWEV